jgi:DNA polymerase-1
MVKCYAWIKEEGLKTIPVLQVHDELVFDVPKDEQKLVKIKLPALMNNVVPLSVDLPVDVHLVTSWGQAKE